MKSELKYEVGDRVSVPAGANGAMMDGLIQTVDPYTDYPYHIGFDAGRMWWAAESEIVPLEPLRNDAVHSPAHYVTPGYPFEVIDAIEAWGLNYRLGAVVKYVARHARKGKPLEDLRKARWYLDREISKMEAGTK